MTAVGVLAEIFETNQAFPKIIIKMPGFANIRFRGFK
jgi:hypothetical protein